MPSPKSGKLPASAPTDSAGWSDSRQIPDLQQQVLKWFSEHARDLPWRQDITPYRTWISEIMLQQTQVATVIDYWIRFLKRFPTVTDLASAEEAEVLKLWEGLGYYRRARQLHAAARQIVDRHDGQFPTDYRDVLALPGIGRYTAGAILSISTDQPLPILEGNTIRLFARLLGMKTDPTRTENQKRLWQFAEQIVPRKNPGAFNQGLMEIGGQVCRLRSPECSVCPLKKHCPTFRNQWQETIPAPKEKPTQYESRFETVVLIERSGKYLCRQIPAGQRWAGLWDFVRIDLTDQIHNIDIGYQSLDDQRQQQLLQERVQETTGLQTHLHWTPWSIRHGVTRYRIHLRSVHSRKVKGRIKSGSGFQWLTREQVQDHPFNVTARKFCDQYLLRLNE